MHWESRVNVFESVSVGEWVVRWLSDYAAVRVCGSTYRGYEGVVRRYIVPLIGGVPLEGLRPEMVQALYRRLQGPGGGLKGKPLSARTVLQVHVVLHQSLRKAVALGRIDSNPADRAQGVERPRIRYKQMISLDEHETAQLLGRCDGTRLYIPALLAVTTGLRRGEMLSLTWADIDMERSTLGVYRTWDRLGARYELKEPKTRRSRRVVVMPEMTTDALRIHRRIQARRREELGARYSTAYGDLVVCMPDGTPWPPDSFSSAYRDFIRREGLRGRFHDLRRSQGSQLIKVGVPMKVVSERLGHASTAFTMDVYTDVLSGMQEDAAARIDSMLKAAVMQYGEGCGSIGERTPHTKAPERVEDSIA